MSTNRTTPIYTVQPASPSRMPKSVYIVVFAISHLRQLLVGSQWQADAARHQERKSTAVVHLRDAAAAVKLDPIASGSSPRQRTSSAPPRVKVRPPPAAQRRGIAGGNRGAAAGEARRRGGRRRRPRRHAHCHDLCGREFPHRRRVGQRPGQRLCPDGIASNGTRGRRRSIKRRRRPPPGRTINFARPRRGWTPPSTSN